MIRWALPLLLAAGPALATPVLYDCGLTKAPPHGIAAPLLLEIDPASGKARVADPMTRFYAGGPVAAELAPQGKGWRLTWRLTGVGGDGSAPQAVTYRADLAADGKLIVTATPEGAQTPLRAEGQCWVRGD